MAGWLLHTRVRLALFDAYRLGVVNGGDTLAIEIERIGRLEVSIQAADANAPIAEPRRLQVAS